MAIKCSMFGAITVYRNVDEMLQCFINEMHPYLLVCVCVCVDIQNILGKYLVILSLSVYVELEKRILFVLW